MKFKRVCMWFLISLIIYRCLNTAQTTKTESSQDIHMVYNFLKDWFYFLGLQQKKMNSFKAVHIIAFSEIL